MKQKLYRCVFEENQGTWEAVCLDLDIAVQGQSFEETYGSLRDGIAQYVDYVATLPESDKARLLNRKAPVSVRAKFLWLAISQIFSDRRDSQCGEMLLAA
jgi:hypothetical protein